LSRACGADKSVKVSTIIEMLDGLYDRHHPDHLRMAAHFIGYRSGQNLSIPFAQADTTVDTIFNEEMPRGSLGCPPRAFLADRR
jgi:hypothetical protein